MGRVPEKALSRRRPCGYERGEHHVLPRWAERQPRNGALTPAPSTEAPFSLVVRIRCVMARCGWHPIRVQPKGRPHDALNLTQSPAQIVRHTSLGFETSVNLTRVDQLDYPLHHFLVLPVLMRPNRPQAERACTFKEQHGDASTLSNHRCH